MSAIGMPPHLLALFEARPPIEYLKPIKKKRLGFYNGISDYVINFEEKNEYDEFIKIKNKEPKFETPKERKERLKLERMKNHEEKLREEIKKYNPQIYNKIYGDAYKTLFVSRLNYETTEKKLKREFEEYGPIRKVRIIYDKKIPQLQLQLQQQQQQQQQLQNHNINESNYGYNNNTKYFIGKPKGYAFIEYEYDKDMKEAYKQGDGRKIDGKRVLVDVERGRTVSGWLPRRLGGGRGPSRGANHPINITRRHILHKMMSSVITISNNDNLSNIKDQNDDNNNIIDTLSDNNNHHNSHKHSKSDKNKLSKSYKEKKSHKSRDKGDDKKRERRKEKKDKDRYGKEKHRERN